MNQESDSGDHQYHHSRKRVKKKSDVDIELTRGDPGEKHLSNDSGIFRQRKEIKKEFYAQKERESDRTAGDQGNDSFVEPTNKQAIQQESYQRKERYEIEISVHSTIALPFHQVEPVGIDRIPIAVDCYNNRQTHRRLGCGDSHDQKDKNMTIH